MCLLTKIYRSNILRKRKLNYATKEPWPTESGLYILCTITWIILKNTVSDENIAEKKLVKNCQDLWNTKTGSTDHLNKKLVLHKIIWNHISNFAKRFWTESFSNVMFSSLKTNNDIAFSTVDRTPW